MPPADDVTPETYALFETLFPLGCALSSDDREALLAARCHDDERAAGLLRRAWADADAARAEGGRATEPARPVPSRGAREGGGTTAATLSDELVGRRVGDLRILERIDAGGMGVVYRARQEEPDRLVALKVVRPELAVSPMAVQRFREETAMLARLEHAGIVPLFRSGELEDGRPYFTMRLVEGEDVGELFRRIAAGVEGASLVRGVRVLASICRTMTLAHGAGVVHRDLKPSNVRIGRHGEVFVLDWGIGTSSSGRLPDAAGHGGRDAVERLTRAFVGTFAYASPEQILNEEVDAQTDVYAVGAMLHHLLAGEPPFAGRAATVPELVELKRRGRSGAVGRDVPPALVAIRDRAMHPDRAVRYASMEALADDLEAFLEGRVVRAHRTGPLAELLAWIRRNPPFAATVLATVVGSVVGVGWLVSLGRELARQEIVTAAERLDELAADFTRRVVPSQVLGTADAADIDAWTARAEGHLADARRREEQVAALAPAPGGRDREASSHAPREATGTSGPEPADGPGGADEGPRSAPARRDEAPRSARARLLEELETEWRERNATGALAHDDDEAAVEALRHRLAAAVASEGPADQPLPDPGTSGPTDPVGRQRADDLVRLVARQRGFTDPLDGWLARAARLRRLRAALEAIASHPAARARWTAFEEAMDSADPAGRYTLPVVVPRAIDILPLQLDTATGLWEFLHLPSTELELLEDPAGLLDHGDGIGRALEDRAAAGTAPPASGLGPILEERTGLVLVLVPGGSFPMGAELADTGEPGTVRLPAHLEGSHPFYVSSKEEPVHQVTLGAYFIGAHEVSQAQWERMSWWVLGFHVESYHRPGRRVLGPPGRPERLATLLHPVEQVSWTEARDVLAAMALELPTEARWERATRGGTTTPWSTGPAPASLVGSANLADRSAVLSEMAYSVGFDLPPGFDDGFGGTAPVGSYRPNPFGLYDVHGNVWEWCLDRFVEHYERSRARPGDGLREGESDTGQRIDRGGSYYHSGTQARSAFRAAGAERLTQRSLGLRVCRETAPEPAGGAP